MLPSNYHHLSFNELGAVLYNLPDDRPLYLGMYLTRIKTVESVECCRPYIITKVNGNRVMAYPLVYYRTCLGLWSICKDKIITHDGAGKPISPFTLTWGGGVLKSSEGSRVFRGRACLSNPKISFD